MSVAWYPKQWWDRCMSKDEEKEIDPIITEKCWKLGKHI